MSLVHFVTHPEVVIDPTVAITEWPLSDKGRERMERFAAEADLSAVTSLFSSTERKARDGAEILCRALGLPVTERADLGENDRSATGYLPPEEFETVADAFFAAPEGSARGWARAVGEQRRIVTAVADLTRVAPPGDILIVSHGAVGALLLCDLLGVGIAREYDQPGRGGGNLFNFERETRLVIEGWRPIEGSAAHIFD